MTTPQSGNSRGAGRVAFLARMEDIRTMVHAGYSLTAIYKHHGAGLSVMSYSQFARYVGRYIGRGDRPMPAKRDALANPMENGAARAASVEAVTPQKKISLEKRRPFYDPVPRGDLI